MFPLSVLNDFSRESYAKGHADGVLAAREAVAALWGNCYYECRDQALAAIDALRGDA